MAIQLLSPRQDVDRPGAQLCITQIYTADTACVSGRRSVSSGGNTKAPTCRHGLSSPCCLPGASELANRMHRRVFFFKTLLRDCLVQAVGSLERLLYPVIRPMLLWHRAQSCLAKCSIPHACPIAPLWPAVQTSMCFLCRLLFFGSWRAHVARMLRNKCAPREATCSIQQAVQLSGSTTF